MLKRQDEALLTLQVRVACRPAESRGGVGGSGGGGGLRKRRRSAVDTASTTYCRVPTQILFSNSLCFPCLTLNFPCANLRNLKKCYMQN